MSHLAAESAYKKLEERINKFPQGAPPSETLYKILSILFNEKEAGLVSQLPIKPFTIKTASRIWKLDAVSTEISLRILKKEDSYFNWSKSENGEKSVKRTVPRYIIYY